MKMLQSTAQTLPLFVGKPGEKAPPLCGAIPADTNYIAKVHLNLTNSPRIYNKMLLGRRYGSCFS